MRDRRWREGLGGKNTGRSSVHWSIPAHHIRKMYILYKTHIYISYAWSKKMINA
jgi:hypothetical protein